VTSSMPDLTVGSTLPRALLQTWSLSAEMGSARVGGRPMSDFKGRHFEGEMALWR